MYIYCKNLNFVLVSSYCGHYDVSGQVLLSLIGRQNYNPANVKHVSACVLESTSLVSLRL
jgi:hypothetical protein